MRSIEELGENVWNSFQNLYVQTEIDRLSGSERDFVDETAQILVRDVDLFQIVCSCPHGSEELSRKCQFWSCRIDKEGAAIDPKTLGVQLVNSLSPFLHDAIVMHEELSPNVTQVFRHPYDERKIIMKCGTNTPYDLSNLSDRRGSPNSYRLVLPRAAMKRFLEEGKIPLWPFILRNAAMILNPKAARIFFDVPMQGLQLLDEGDNPTTMIDYETRHIIHYASTKNNHAVPTINENFRDDPSLIARARSIQGLHLYSIYPMNWLSQRIGDANYQQQCSERAKERFLLTGERGYDWPDVQQYL